MASFLLDLAEKSCTEQATHSFSTIIYRCSMTEGGLAKTTKAIQLGDELVEVDGTSVKVEWTRVP